MSTRNFEPFEPVEPGDKSHRYHSEGRESVDAVLQRMCDAIDAKPEHGGFARALDISSDTIKTWRRRGKVPLRFLSGFAEAHQANLHWLQFGAEQPAPEPESAAYGPPPEPTVVTTGGSATVHRIESPGESSAARPDAAWREVLALVLDELYASGRRLPSKKLIALVDLLVELQQHGARLEPAVLRSQLRLIA